MPDNIAWHIWVGTITTIVPATLAVAGRFVARHLSGARYWWDDWMMLVALVINWAMAITRWVAVLRFGHGRHASTLPKQTVEDFQKSFLAVQITYFGDAVTTKAALLFLYYRIFGVNSTFRRTIYLSGFVITAYFIACTIAAIAGCQPVSYFWNKSQPGHCMDEVNFFRWNGITSMLMDFLILCLPLPMTWRVKANRRQKIILSGIFLLGFFVCIVSILRIIAFNGSHQGDPTYTTVDTAAWSSVEQSVAILCGCLPTLRPLFRRLYGSTENDTTTGTATGSRTVRTSTIHLTHLTSRSGGEGSSTVGFTRLSEEDPSLSVASLTNGGLGPGYGVKADVHAATDARDEGNTRRPSGIQMTREIHQTFSS